jgi:hypothetical protein
MTAWVLVLAGVAAGDGGTGTGTATAPLTESLRLGLSREWVGTAQVVYVTVPVRLSGGRLAMRGWATQPFALTLSPGGLARGVWGEDRVHGAYRVRGDCVLVCVTAVKHPRPTACTASDGVLFTLKPAARQP